MHLCVENNQIYCTTLNHNFIKFTKPDKKQYDDRSS